MHIVALHAAGLFISIRRLKATHAWRSIFTQPTKLPVQNSFKGSTPRQGVSGQSPNQPSTNASKNTFIEPRPIGKLRISCERKPSQRAHQMKPQQPHTNVSDDDGKARRRSRRSPTLRMDWRPTKASQGEGGGAEGRLNWLPVAFTQFWQ